MTGREFAFRLALAAHPAHQRGRQTFLLVHGWSCNGGFWREQVTALRGKARLILIDLPGHGQSDKPHTDYNMDFFARAVLAVLRDAHVDKATLIGHSMGLPVIRHVYADVPGQIAAMVIVDGSVAKKGAPQPDRSATFREMRENYEACIAAAAVLVDAIAWNIKRPRIGCGIAVVAITVGSGIAVLVRVACSGTRTAARRSSADRVLDVQSPHGVREAQATSTAEVTSCAAALPRRGRGR